MSDIHTSAAVGLLAALLWSGDAPIANNYRLPPSKQNVQPCRTAALALKPGTVENFRVVWERRSYRFRFDIRARDDREWAVFCDGATGHILWVEPGQPVLPG